LAESGRGLHLVQSLAEAFTIVPNADGGTTVRARFAWRTLTRA
jgi:hypothetical protein